MWRENVYCKITFIMNVIIIEDEVLSQEELSRMIKSNFPEFKIVATLTSVKDSVEWIKHNDVQLIFMDIQLSDGDCFSIFNHTDISCPVIFTTAYDQYTMQAFKNNGVGYLLKPFSETELTDVVNRLKSFSNGKDTFKHVQQDIIQANYKSRILIRNKDEYSYIAINDIAYFLAEDKIAWAVLTNGKKYIINYTLDSIEAILDPKHFFRLSRNCIASICSISKISKYFNGRLKIKLTSVSETEFIISKARVQDFLRWLDS